MSGGAPRSRVVYGGAALAVLGPALSLAYWPGLVTYDSVRQYDQALSGQIDDWHPPVMEWIWRQLLPVWPGPAPMLLLQLALLAGGLVALVLWAGREGRPRTALAIGAAARLPLPVALMGAVLKDGLMAGALMAASGLLALAHGRRATGTRVAGAALVLFAATLRFNAFLAGVPLLVALAPPAWRATLSRLALVAGGSAALTLAAMPLANRLIGAERSGVALSLVIFDLGGIGQRTGSDQFPPLGLRDPVTANARCYTPIKWDSYSWWVDPLCPINFDAVRAAFARQPGGAYGWWLRAIAAHPAAYAAHRLAHWNVNARFLVTRQIERPVQRVSAPNPWGFAVPAGEPLDTIDAAARGMAWTPLGWPCVAIALAAGALLAGWRRPVVAPLAASALLYGIGYAGVSVASELRYYLWTGMTAALAAILLAPTLTRRRNWLLFLAPALLVTLAGTAARLA